jgi:hypothetical protein
VPARSLQSALASHLPGLPACLPEQFFAFIHTALQHTQALILLKWCDSGISFASSFPPLRQVDEWLIEFDAQGEVGKCERIVWNSDHSISKTLISKSVLYLNGLRFHKKL